MGDLVLVLVLGATLFASLVSVAFVIRGVWEATRLNDYTRDCLADLERRVKRLE